MRPSALLLSLPLCLTACDPARDLAPVTDNESGLVIDNEDPADPARPHYFNIGMLEHGTRSELPVYLVNRAAEEVTIQHVDPACMCTCAKRIRLVDEAGTILEEGDVKRRGNVLTVPPGGRVQLLIGVNTRSVVANTKKLAIMRVVSDHPENPYLTIEVHLETNRAFMVTPASIRLGEIPQGYGGSAQTSIMTGKRGGGERLMDVKSTTGDIETNLDYLFVNGEHTWTLTATVPPLKPMGALREKVVLRTLLEDGEEDTLEIDVWAQVVDDVGFDRSNPHFGALNFGETRTLNLDLVARVPGMRVRMEGVELTGPASDHLTVTWSPKYGEYVDDDGAAERWTLKIVTHAELPSGRFEADLVALLADDQVPEVRTKLNGFVR